MTQDVATRPPSLPSVFNDPSGGPIAPIVPRTIAEVLEYARFVITANAIPDALSKENGRPLADNEIVSRVVTIIASGSEVGLPPMAALANIALINKRRSIWGAGAIALLQSRGVLEEYKIERIGTQPGPSEPTAKFADDFGIRVTLKRRGQATPYVGEFTVGRAKRAHLWMNIAKKPWVEHPDRQLQWRAFHIAAVDGFADVLMGLLIAEVAQDIPAEGPTPKTDTSFLDDEPQAQLSPSTEPTTADMQPAVVDVPAAAVAPAGGGDTPSPPPPGEPLAGSRTNQPEPEAETLPEEDMLLKWSTWGTKVVTRIATCPDLQNLSKIEGIVAREAKEYAAHLGAEKALALTDLIAERRRELGGP